VTFFRLVVPAAAQPVFRAVGKPHEAYVALADGQGPCGTALGDDDAGGVAVADAPAAAGLPPAADPLADADVPPAAGAAPVAAVGCERGDGLEHPAAVIAAAATTPSSTVARPRP
jgi:hypothetical protein